MFCPECGGRLDPDSSFCSNCGTRISKASDKGGLLASRISHWPLRHAIWIATGSTALLSIIAIWFFFYISGQKIEGVVFEAGFDKPLKDALVTLERTTFEAKTNSSGRYALDFAPGKLRIKYSKPGYTEEVLLLEVTQKTRVPVEKVTLWKIPDSPGVYFFGASAYVPINRCNIARSTRELLHSQTVIGGKVREDTYRVNGTFTLIPSAGPHHFMDSDPNPLQVYKVLDTSGFILHMPIYRSWGELYGSPTKKIGAETPAEKADQIRKGMIIRRFQLGPGKYAFVGEGMYSCYKQGATEIKCPGLQQPAYCFEIKGAGKTEAQSTGGFLTPDDVDQEVKNVVLAAARAEEAFFTDANRYTTRAEDLVAKGLRIPQGVVVNVDLPDATSYVVTVRKDGGTAPSWSFDSRVGTFTPGQ